MKKINKIIAVIMSVTVVLSMANAPYTSQAAGYKLNKASLQLEIGKSVKLKVKKSGKVVAAKKITWKSSAPKVASVSVKGIVTAKKSGSATISAKVAKTTLKCMVKVTRPKATGSLTHEGYTLEQVVVLSRHNIRSPLSGGDSLLGRITPYSWFKWSSNPSELSTRGGVLETENGQFFRKWLESEGLFPENYHPKGNEVKIYSNSKQRTIATAQYFTAGLLPTANKLIDYKVEYDKMDPVFTPQLTYVTDQYTSDCISQINELYEDDIKGLKDNYELLSNVIDMKKSPAYKDKTVSDFKTDDTEYVFKENAEPGMTGSLKTATSVSDALVLQYYEEEDPVKAAFGKDLSIEQWEAISEIKDVYGDVLFTAPLVAINTAHPLLEEIKEDINSEGRKFTFLCGHDSNIGSVLAALDVDDYSLPQAIEKKTPIGSKVVFSKYKDPSGNELWSIDLVYQTVDQLREMPLLSLVNHPAIYQLSLKGLKKNADGLYSSEDFMKRLDEKIKAYDDMISTYSKAAAA